MGLPVPRTLAPHFVPTAPVALPALRGCGHAGVAAGEPPRRCAEVLHADGGERRVEIERFIASRYADVYGARIAKFLPCLLAITDPAGVPAAAAGFGTAAGRALFLERYLAVPVEHALAARTRGPVERDRVAEVGNLAATRPGDTRELVRALVAAMSNMPGPGIDWVVFTATRQVRNALARCGLLGYDLGRATSDAPGVDASQWGSYYDNDPRVIGGSLRVAAAALAGRGPVDVG